MVCYHGVFGGKDSNLVYLLYGTHEGGCDRARKMSWGQIIKRAFNNGLRSLDFYLLGIVESMRVSKGMASNLQFLEGHRRGKEQQGK